MTTLPKVFPFPVFFEQQLQAEWESPAMTRRPLAMVRKLYLLPKFMDDFLKVPLVDAPILAILSTGLLTEDGQGSIRNTWDKKIDQDLKRSHESSPLAIYTSVMASIVARACHSVVEEAARSGATDRFSSSGGAFPDSQSQCLHS